MNQFHPNRTNASGALFFGIAALLSSLMGDLMAALAGGRGDFPRGRHAEIRRARRGRRASYYRDRPVGRGAADGGADLRAAHGGRPCRAGRGTLNPYRARGASAKKCGRASFGYCGVKEYMIQYLVSDILYKATILWQRKGQYENRQECDHRIGKAVPEKG